MMTEYERKMITIQKKRNDILQRIAEYELRRLNMEVVDNKPFDISDLPEEIDKEEEDA